MFAAFRKYFFSGLIILAPLAFTFFVFSWLIEKVGGSFKGILFFIPQHLLDRSDLEIVWNGIATVMVIAVIAVFGYFSRYFLAKYMWAIGERIMNNLPFISTVYASVKQIVQTFSSNNRAVFQKVALVQFPREGSYAIGFVTGDSTGEIPARAKKHLVNVFVPTTPNPTSGFLVMLEESTVTYLDMTVGEGMKLIISGGAVAPEWAKLKKAEEAEDELEGGKEPYSENADEETESEIESTPEDDTKDAIDENGDDAVDPAEDEAKPEIADEEDPDPEKEEPPLDSDKK